MPDRGQRDRAIEHMLKRGVAAPHAVDAPGACVDGETLAAWSSGTLDAGAAARVEEHLADCARCQSMLAAFVRTAPDIAAPVPWWKRAHVGWLVPLATAATVAAIWVAVPSRDQSPSESAVVLDRQVEPSARAKPPSADADRQTVANQPAPPVSSRQPSIGATTSSQREADAARQERRQATVPVLSKEEAAKRRADEASARAGTREREAKEGAARAPRPLEAAPPVTLPEAAAPPPPAAPSARAESAAADTMSLRRLAPTVDLVSPGGATRWRIVDAQVQRSTTQGASWQPITLPAPGAITAGHSPAPLVVWLVGKAGAIFVTSDGTQFQQVPFVSAADLTAVVAVDDQQATVTAADGRRFRTSNRGRDWSALQP